MPAPVSISVHVMHVVASNTRHRSQCYSISSEELERMEAKINHELSVRKRRKEMKIRKRRRKEKGTILKI